MKYILTLTVLVSTILMSVPVVFASTPKIMSSFGGMTGSPEDGTLAFTGWAYDTSDPSTALRVEIRRGTHIIDTVIADGPTQSLDEKNIGNHRFTWEIPKKYYGTTYKWSLKAFALNGDSVQIGDTPLEVDIPKPSRTVAGVFGKPRGSAEDSSLKLAGWIADKRDSSKILQAQIERDDQVVATIPADQGPELNERTGVTGNHRYSYTIPAKYYGSTNTWKITAIDTDGKRYAIVNGTQELTLPSYAAKVPFKIYWGFNTKYEQIADMQPDSPEARDVAKLKSIVDGYFINVNTGGRLSYWPKRPYECGVNDKTQVDPNLTLTYKKTIDGTTTTVTELVDDIIARCTTQMYEDNKVYAASAGYKQVGKQYNGRQAQPFIARQAWERVVKNLGLADEIVAGKDVQSEMILGTRNFEYSSSNDTLSIVKDPTGEFVLPDSYGYLRSHGATPTSVLSYQEPSRQEPNGSLLKIPLVPGGSGYEVLPKNGRILNLVGDAFKAVGMKSPLLKVNVRRWTSSSPSDMQVAVNSKYFGAANFEGGTSRIGEKLGSGQTEIDNFAEGMVWFLKNTSGDKLVTVLMPPYITEEEIIGDQDAADKAQIGRIKQYIRELNTAMIAHGYSVGVCTDRMIFISGGYGKWLHPNILPIARNGHNAGTVSGQIATLNDMRTELCGSGTVAGASIAPEEAVTLIDQIMSAIDDIGNSILGLVAVWR